MLQVSARAQLLLVFPGRFTMYAHRNIRPVGRRRRGCKGKRRWTKARKHGFSQFLRDYRIRVHGADLVDMKKLVAKMYPQWKELPIDQRIE